MSPHHALIEIQPDGNSRHRHDSQPPDETRNPNRSRTWYFPPAHMQQTTFARLRSTTVRPARTNIAPPASTGS
jgi:hypothetical protein